MNLTGQTACTLNKGDSRSSIIPLRHIEEALGT